MILARTSISGCAVPAIPSLAPAATCAAPSKVSQNIVYNVVPCYHAAQINDVSDRSTLAEASLYSHIPTGRPVPPAL